MGRVCECICNNDAVAVAGVRVEMNAISLCLIDFWGHFWLNLQIEGHI